MNGETNGAMNGETSSEMSAEASGEKDKIMNGETPKTIAQRIEGTGLRATHQRVELGELLFTPGDRHVTAEELYNEALNAGQRISLATVYNTLHQFTEVGLLREVAVVGSTAFFDTNTDNHCHFYRGDGRQLLDIDPEKIEVLGLPQSPAGTRIARIDVVVHLEDDEPS